MHYKEKILKELVDLKEDGSFLLNMNYYNFATGLRMCDDVKWEQILKAR
jgi:carbamoyltransferase